MKTLHRYLLRQVIASILMTMAVFTFVLLLGNALRDVLPLLMNKEAAFNTFFQAVGLLIPYVWVFALPMAMLTATLLVFGRFSADHELTAARAGGLSLISIVWPVLLLSLLLCGVSAYVNMELAPRTRIAMKRLLLKFSAEATGWQLPEGTFISDKDGTTLVYIGRRKDNKLEDVTIYLAAKGTNAAFTGSSPRGEWNMNAADGKVAVHLYDVIGVKLQPDGDVTWKGDLHPDPFPLPGSEKDTWQPSVADMSYSQLRKELKKLDALVPHRLSVTNRIGQPLPGQRKTKTGQTYDLSSPVRVHMHREIAFSFACFGFTLIGIPLGIRVHRRETNIGFGVAMVLVLVYYGFVVLALSLAKRPEFAPQLIFWLPNFIFQGAGAFLLWRANKGV